MDTLLLSFLESQLFVEKAKLLSYNNDYARNAGICGPIIHASEAAIASLNEQIILLIKKQNDERSVATGDAKITEP